MRAESYVLNTWYVAGFSSEFPTGKLQGQTIAERPLVMWRAREGEVVAFDGRCAHKRMPLKDGRLLDDGTVECPYHGFCYDATGACVRIPSQEGAIPAKARLKPYPVVEQDGLVWVWPGDPSRIGDVRPPRTPEIGSDAWDTIGSDPIPVPANYRLLIENLLDITHFYPLHDGNVGDIAHSRIPVQVVEETIDGNRSVRTIREANNYKQPPFFRDWFGYDVVDRHHTHCMVSPGLTRVQMRTAPPGKLGTEAERGFVLYHTHTPVDRTHHVWRWGMNTHAGHRAGSDPSRRLIDAMVANFPEVVAQDLWALERQQEMYDLPDGDYEEVHVKADRAMLIVRKVLGSMEAAERVDAAPAPALERVG
jgi:vanillate O-demethylase monooxygenase subunit